MDSNSTLEELMKVLAHKIRTPLSIIQNELTCIKEKIDSEEYLRIQEACRSINKILKDKPKELIKSPEGNNE